MVLPARRAFLSLIASAVLLTGTAFAPSTADAQAVETFDPVATPSRDRLAPWARLPDAG